MREVGVIAALLLVLSLGAGAYWMYQSQGDTRSENAASRSVAAQSWKKNGDQQRRTTRVVKKAPAAIPASAGEASVKVPATDDVTRIDVYFDFDRSTLSKEAKKLLRTHVKQILGKDGWRVTIQGYTDKLGSPSYNTALGLRRAEAVKKFLLQLGVPEHAIRVSSMGKAGAICRQKAESCLQRNRRAHLHWSKAQQGSPALSASGKGQQANLASARPLKEPTPNQASTSGAGPGSVATGKASP